MRDPLPVQSLEADPEFRAFLNRAAPIFAQAQAEDIAPLREALDHALAGTDAELEERMRALHDQLPEIASKVFRNTAGGQELYGLLSATLASQLATPSAPMKHLRPIANRIAAGRFAPPADGWYHLVPKGEYPHADSGLTQVVDDKAVQSMVNRFAALKTTANFAGALVDYDHRSYDPAESSEAAGWIKDLQPRADGVWGRIQWSDGGEQAVTGGRFRYVSPVWMPSMVEHLDAKRIRPLQLDTAGLTNAPNMRGMVPLSNRSTLTITPASAAEPQAETKSMKNIATRLGLTPEASEDTILAEIGKLANRATTAETGLSTLKSEHEAITNRHNALLGEVIQAELDVHGITDPDARGKLVPVLSPMKNREDRLSFLSLIPKAAGPAAARKEPLTNRQPAQTPAGAAAAVDDLGTKQVAAVSAIRNRERCDFKTAWDLARSEKPELFTTAD